MERTFVLLGALFAFLAVTLGAFGAHVVRGRLTEEALAIFETAARYQMYHALGLFAIAWAMHRWPQTHLQLAGWSFVAGIVLFSGSLYLLSVMGWRWMGAVTPFGGLGFLLGWGVLIFNVWRRAV